MKPLQLKDYTPPKGYMITREATLAERKRIGHETLVKILTPDIWQMLYDLKGKQIRMQYYGVRFDWCIGRLNGDVRVRCLSRFNTESFYNYTEFERKLLKFLDPTFVQRLWKLCNKALCDEKALQGDARKLEEQKEKAVCSTNKVKIHIDIELEAWL